MGQSAHAPLAEALMAAGHAVTSPCPPPPATARWLRVPAGTLLFDDHQPCEGFPFVVEGSVRVIKAAPSGRELPLYRVAPGETCIISSSCLLGREVWRVALSSPAAS